MDEHINAVVGSYANLEPPNGGTRCSWISFSNDGKHVDSNLEHVCHAAMYHYKAHGGHFGLYDQLITSYQALDVSWFTFYDFLVTHLFKQWADIIHLEQTPTGQYYIRVSDLSAIPAEVLYNFCIFTRVPWEFPNYVKIWQNLVKNGMNPSFAFAVCTVGTDDDGVVEEIWEGGNSNHWPIDNTSSLDLLVSCKPKHGEKDYKSHPDAVRPCNCIWGWSATDLRYLIGHKVVDFYNTWKAKHEDLLLAS